MADPLALASNPTTPPARLMTMLTHPDPRVRGALAGNPNLPLRGLFRLLAEFPARVLENGALALARMEDPWIFRKAPVECKRAWAREPALPGWLLEQLAEPHDEEVREGLASNPNTPVGVLARLGLPGEFEEEDEYYPVEPCLLLLKNPSLPDGLRFDIEHDIQGLDFEYSAVEPEDLEFFVQMTSSGQEAEPERVWGVPVPEDEEEGGFPLLSRVENGVYVQPREQEGCQWGVEEAPEGKGPDWRGDDVRSLWGSSPEELVDNDATPAHLLRRWLRHPDAELRAALARHPALGAEELGELAQDPAFVVRLAVAVNPRTPRAALRWLARDESGKIRAAVASNPACDPATRQELQRDERPLVRRSASRFTHLDAHG